jgi:hypothetical protein
MVKSGEMKGEGGRSEGWERRVGERRVKRSGMTGEGREMVRE